MVDPAMAAAVDYPAPGPKPVGASAASPSSTMMRSRDRDHVVAWGCRRFAGGQCTRQARVPARRTRTPFQRAERRRCASSTRARCAKATTCRGQQDRLLLTAAATVTASGSPVLERRRRSGPSSMPWAIWREAERLRPAGRGGSGWWSPETARRSGVRRSPGSYQVMRGAGGPSGKVVPPGASTRPSSVAQERRGLLPDELAARSGGQHVEHSGPWARRRSGWQDLQPPVEADWAVLGDRVPGALS